MKGDVYHTSELHYLQGSPAWDLEAGVTTPTAGEKDLGAVACDVLFYSDLFVIFP